MSTHANDPDTAAELVDPSNVDLRLGPWNDLRYQCPRSVERIGASIADAGVVTPVVARPLASGRLQLVSGQLRIHAARELGLDAIPAHIVERTRAEAVAAYLHSNRSSKMRTTKLHLAWALVALQQELVANGAPNVIDRLMECAGKGRSSIFNYLKIGEGVPPAAVDVCVEAGCDISSILGLPVNGLLEAIRSDDVDVALWMLQECGVRPTPVVPTGDPVVPSAIESGDQPAESQESEPCTSRPGVYIGTPADPVRVDGSIHDYGGVVSHATGQPGEMAAHRAIESNARAAPRPTVGPNGGLGRWRRGLRAMSDALRELWRRGTAAFRRVYRRVWTTARGVRITNWTHASDDGAD